MVVEARLSCLGWKLKMGLCVKARGERGGRDSDEVVTPETWEWKRDDVVVVGGNCNCNWNGLTQHHDMFVQLPSSNLQPLFFLSKYLSLAGLHCTNLQLLLPSLYLSL